MNTLSIDLEYCFGIGKFQHEFKFADKQTNTFLIYAPNGTMKTSFAKTFDSIAKDDKKNMPRDRVYEIRTSRYDILVDGEQILPESILVINAENDGIDGSSKISSFIASKELKQKYDTVYSELELQKTEFIKKLKAVSQSYDCEKEIMETFSENHKDTFFDVVERAFRNGASTIGKYNFRYNDIFDRKENVKKFLDKNTAVLDKYMSDYKVLLANSKFFKEADGKSFGTYQANELLKSIEDNSFFDAGHKFVLEDDTEIFNFQQLQDVVKQEIERIVNDVKLKASFEKVDKAIASNVELRAFKKVIEKENLLLVELKDYDAFKEKVWVSFLSELESETKSLIDFYLSKKSELEKIVEEAKKESALWTQIIDKFNNRFYVPFKVVLTNHDDIVLKQQTASLDFLYSDGTEPLAVNKRKEDLLNILSRGERRAYFILQFLFEIESRKSSAVEQLLVFDDVADSFDYKNKYAIIEYINELHLSNTFKILILTHNFDFYRTISSRLNLYRQSSMAIGDDQRNIFLKDGLYMNDVFKTYLKNIDNPKVFISLITFVRNIIDYTDSNKCDDYDKLTSCLHFKENSDKILVSDLLTLYKNRFSKVAETEIPFEESAKIQDFIFEVANSIIKEGSIDQINLENKIILAIASRLRAERYMISKLPDLDLKILDYNQTRKLTAAYQQKYPDSSNLGIIGRVNLMTPENIHVNSFMYEPLLDMSVFHLVDTYKAVLVLK
ncbi:hypothetical protein FAZ19_07160 [Sphingobacterium alkalisoli]|uniref:Protein CR006 P-loop domain-containing protein n=1 Tax=Sphingobacterium alkalisoli TaxID=1874115 RepID=A0A4U0H4T2_9SPHI|nr:hypothetical protein [Sphingobacterium alkalisoli]TJY66690.1 hypothetical protein FAZ19_07160 [Sphingobacterium alkalisoli]GGH14815.1 hypothetical protein GCM10011418_16020 [Sphingobacterium alkalisoli]